MQEPLRTLADFKSVGPASAQRLQMAERVGIEPTISGFGVQRFTFESYALSVELQRIEL